MISSTLSNEVGQKSGILRDSGNADGSQSASTAEIGVNENSFVPAKPFSHHDRVLLAIWLPLQKQIAIANVPRFRNNILEHQEFLDPSSNCVSPWNGIEI